jgi:hypothetical protein
MTAIRDNADRGARRARFLSELEEWVEAEKSRRKQVAIPRKGLQGIDRLRAQRNALLEGLAKYYYEHPKADVAPGLYCLIGFLSDNDDYGACYLSVPRMAEVLSRRKDTIRAALGRLNDMIGCEVRKAKSTLYWPLIPGCLTGDTSMHWILEYYSPIRQTGRPIQNPVILEGEGVSKTPSPSSPKPPPTPPRHDLTKGDSTKVSNAPALRTRRQMTLDWQPSAEIIAKAKHSLVVTEPQIAAKADKLRSHYLDSSKTADWDVELWDWLAKDFPERQKQVAPGAPGDLSDEVWFQYAAAYYNGHSWPSSVLGPAPGQPGCRCPNHVLASYNRALAPT